MKKNLLVLTLIFLFLIIDLSPAIASNFDPSFIISDQEILDSSDMELAEIESFLVQHNSYLATYRTKNADGVTKSAAEIIYDAAANNYDCGGVTLASQTSQTEKALKCKKITINPKFLLVLLQKEQSLVSDNSPKQSQLDWACGYGCPDGQACNTRWKGFGKQVNSAALQFYDYMINPHHYTYQVGQAYSLSNTGRANMTVIPQNRATAALYNYTPHVYWGNYNFHKLWLKYFSRNYLNGTLMQVKGEAGVWLIQNGQKRPFLSKGALTSRYDPNRIIQVSKTELDKYPTGTGIKFPQYSLVRSPRGTVFLLIDDYRRGFASSEAMRTIGINPEEIVDASWDDINAYTEGEPITATSSYPTGALLQNNKTGGVYWVSNGTKAPILDRIFLDTRFKWKSIHPIEPEKLDMYETVEPALFEDGELLKSNISPAVYVIADQKRKSFTSGKIFEALGYKWENVITVNQKIVDLYEEGDPISEIISEDDLDTATSTADSLISTSTNEINSTATSTIDEETLQNEIDTILNP